MAGSACRNLGVGVLIISGEQGNSNADATMTSSDSLSDQLDKWRLLNLSRRFGHLRCLPGQSIAINNHRTQTANSVIRCALDELNNAGFLSP